LILANNTLAKFNRFTENLTNKEINILKNNFRNFDDQNDLFNGNDNIEDGFQTSFILIQSNRRTSDSFYYFSKFLKTKFDYKKCG